MRSGATAGFKGGFEYIIKKKTTNQKMSIFEDIKENITTRQVAERYGIAINRNGMCRCPFHNDRIPSMKIDKNFYCFGCGEKGDAIDFVSKHFGLSPKDAALKICEDFDLNASTNYHAPPKYTSPPKSNEQLFREIEKHCYLVLCDYLHLLEKWKTEYAPKDENHEWHPYFCEALKEIDLIENLLDTILYGNISDRAFLITNYGRKVIDIERRMEQLR